MNAPTVRHASCSCGKLSLDTRGEPIRLSVCHCLECQRRTGSVFGFQSRFPSSAVTVTGTAHQYERTGDSGGLVRFNFCPHCGSTVYWQIDKFPEVMVIAVGMFADPGFPAPKISVYNQRKHGWVGLPGGIEHFD